LQGTYGTLEDACAAAAKFRNEGLTSVGVRTGAHETGDYSTVTPVYMVYWRSPRCGNWFLRATVDSAAKAQEIAGQMPRDSAEIVLHYAPQ
jgi:hypothetical protein